MTALLRRDLFGLRSWWSRVGIVVAVGALGCLGVIAPATPSVAAAGNVTITGHGWGHGRGMGQYGAYGYAVDHGWGYQQILGHFYGGTYLAGDAGNSGITVELMALTGLDTIATGPGLWVNGELTQSVALRVRRLGGGAFQVETGPSCSGPWAAWRIHGSGLTVGSAADTNQQSQMLSICEGSGSRAYRGRFQVVEAQGAQHTFNEVAVDDYLRGVVPRESPASWGGAGGGRGMEALKAQAVAARSYGLSGGVRPSGARVCDTTACQVYSGSATRNSGGVLTSLESAYTDQAVAATQGQVMRSSSGAIARTEFSSSSGGYSAGGTFPAVVDEGDDTSANPNHQWTATLALSTVAAALGTGEIGSIAVTGRNGLGADGGRVTQVAVVAVNGARTTFTGTQVRSALGLKSDWFSISGTAQAEAVVRALYQDILGREVDPSGLATFSAAIMATGSARGTAASLEYSTERMYRLVEQQYRGALHREPDPSGLQFWTGHLLGGMSVHQLKAGIYGSAEAVAILGGGSVEAWAAQVYLLMLGRPASAGETAYWAGIARQNGYQAVALGIASSVEAAMRTVSSCYWQFLGREPDGSGLGTFIPYALEGHGDFTIPIALGNSVEYWNRAQARS